jgi:predicted PurR-regulated permease PerM
MIIGAYKYAPKLIWQLNELVQQVIVFYSRPFEPTEYKVVNYIMETLRKIDVVSYLDQGLNLLVKTISDIGQWGFDIGIAIIMSLFFMLEKEKVTHFTANFKESKIVYIYDELAYFGKKFVFSFGKVIEVQFMISLINCIISTFFLWTMGFTNLFGLAIMIFLFGLVPVVGVFVSLIPLCAIAFKIGGIAKIVYVLIMVAGLHAFEAYFMNPKFMSSKTHLPIFYTFTVLIVAEHFFGVWGLILGVPIFMFLLDLLEVPVSLPLMRKPKSKKLQ